MIRMTATVRRALGVVVAQLLALIAALLLVMTPAAAQSTVAPDYAAWERSADATEQALDAEAGDETLNDLRAQIVDWRTQFTEAQGINAPQIATIRDQIQALGPKPADGATEAPETAQRRKELETKLSEVQAPSLAAVEAHSRADALVTRIDRLQRDRQTSALLYRQASPLLPGAWAETLDAVTEYLGALGNEVRARLSDGRTGQALRSNGLLIAGALAVAALFLLRGRAFIEALATRLLVGASVRGRAVASFLVSLGQIVLPVIGLYLFALALTHLDLFGGRGEALLILLPIAGASLFVAHWLGRRLFPRAREVEPILAVQGDRRTEARLHIGILGLSLGLAQMLDGALLPMMGLPAADPATAAGEGTRGVLSLPLIGLAALSLYRLAQLLRRGIRETAAEDVATRDRFVGIATLIAILVAVIAPLIAAFGYIHAANALLWPMVLSLGLIGVLILVQDFIADIYAMILRDSDGARDALIPVLIGFALVLLALPVFGLIWGMRVEELAELWTRFRNGMSLGGVKISPSGILTFAVVFAAGYMVTRLLQGTMRNTVLPKTRIDKGGQNAIVSGLGYVGIFLAALAAITSAGIDLSSLAIVAGALSVGIGFGLQNIVSNFVSGIILLIERPITEGDWIEVGGQQGYVKAISVRSTRIETFDRTDVIVPNADFVSGQVINYTRGNLNGRIILPVGVAYGSDTRRVAEILMEIAESHPMVMLNPKPNVLFVGFGASALNFEIRAILSDVNQIMSVRSEMNHQIAERFAAENIEIPFPQQDLWLRNPESLRPRPPLKLRPSGEAEAADDAPQLTVADMHGHGSADRDTPNGPHRAARLDEDRDEGDEGEGGDGEGSAQS